MPTITITLSASQASRLQTAWMKVFSQETPPDLTAVRTHLVRELRAIVIIGEKQIAEEALAAPEPFDPT